MELTAAMLRASSAWYILFAKAFLVNHINHGVLRTPTVLTLAVMVSWSFIEWECNKHRGMLLAG